MASSTANTAVSVLLQKASQQYLECRRNVSAKVDEVKTLDGEIQTLFERINAMSQEASRDNKSVGRLEISIVEVQGDAPVENAVVTVDIDPEYEEPEAAVVDVTEKKEGEETEKAEGEDETKEDAAEEEEEAVEEKKEGQPKARRSVVWSDADGFPLSLVFDPVQSREAVVTIAISPPSVDDEDSEPVKEFRIPVASLFQTGSINRWYVLKKIERVHVDKASITEVDEAAASEKAAAEPVQEEATQEQPEKSAEQPKVTEEAEQPATTPESDAVEGAAAAETPVAEDAKTDVQEKDEPKAEDAPEPTMVSAVATIESTDEVHVLKEGKLHVMATFTMSEIEKLTQTVMVLSQQKNEAEATLAVLEREAASLRTKYERLNTSQRSLSSSVVKPRSTLLGGRGLGGPQPRVEKSSYQKIKDSVSAVLTPQRTQVIASFAMFVGSVALFHFQGENLLA